MQSRIAEKLLKQYARQFRAVAVVGPRQSGKTTLVKKVFPKKPYVSLEDPDDRILATNDPRAFLNRFKKGAIIDEAQRHLAETERDLASQNVRVGQLEQTVAQTNAQLRSLGDRIRGFESSTSWRITAPVRLVGQIGRAHV